MKAFFHVQHLLGIGHLKRAAVLARALERAGFEVTLASGGAPVAGIAALQLPPASSPDFRTLLDAHGHPVDEAWKACRREMLLKAFRSFSPDVLVVELFPFGRRQMSFELIPLLEEAGSSLVVCSVRDILQPNPAREEETLARFGVEALHPDDFLLGLIDAAPGAVCAAVKRQRESLRNPPKSVVDFLATLEGQGLPQAVARLRQFTDLL